MKKIFSLCTMFILLFATNVVFETNSVMATTDIDIKKELQQEVPEAVVNNQAAEDVLDEPIFDDSKKQKKKIFTGNISKFIIRILEGMLLLVIIVICLFFIVIANKQRQVEAKRKKMSANTNVINAVDNFARHRIQK